MRGWAGIVAGAFFLASGTLPSAAHPLGNFTINHLAKVEIGQHFVTIRYVVDMAEIPTFQVLAERRVPSGGPGRIAGLESWGRDEARLISAGLTVEADGTRLTLAASTPLVITRPGAGGLPILYFVDRLTAAYPASRTPRTLSVSDDNYAERIGWKDIVIAPQTEPTHELRSYPNALLGSPRSITSVRAEINPQGRVLAVEARSMRALALAGTTSQVRSNLLSDMLAKESTNLAAVALTLLVAVGLGGLHALEPGHGKTLLAVSLVGARATMKQAFVLATALAVAHTAGVIALGVALLAFARIIVPENIYPWISLGSGICVALLGASSLARYVKRLRSFGHRHDPAHGHHHQEREEAHAHGHSHNLPLVPGNRPLAFGKVLFVAMSGNIAPCPAALVVLLTALSLHRLGYGVLVIIAFSAGLAAVLTGLGIAVVRGAAWLGEHAAFGRVAQYGPLATGTVISSIGVVMLAQAASSIAEAPVLLVAALASIAIAGYALAPGHSHAHGLPAELPEQIT